MVTSRGVVADDATPFDDCVALTDQVPSASVPRSHDPLEPVAVNVHVTGVEPAFVAVTVTEDPLNNPVTLMFGVESLVLLSVLDEPVSDEADKSTALGAGIPTAAVAADTDVVDPFAFVPVAANLRKEPASAAVSVYDEDVAPLIAVQFAGTLVVAAPEPVHRYH